ncbi:MAG TPA: hypothetical protein RMG95_03130, partial [Polyangiaceae bacterium LLY-WYZ-15_(1-7)]|nr:hypothetical protein [Polyangiaceae bacterium LLY-WYZ-15_(1-7)]
MSPISELRQLASGAETGEFVCAGQTAEVHVHLQSGRVAWATSSAARVGLAQLLQDFCALDGKALGEVVRSCQRERRPLGETLVQRGLAAPAQIRAALRAQIEDALATLPGEARTESVFLPRGPRYRSYDLTYTFAFDDLCRRRRRDSAKRLPAIPGPAPAASEQLARRLQALDREQPDVRWIERRHASARGDGQRVPDGTPLESDAELVVVRGGRQSLLGAALDEERVWCGVHPDAIVGAMVPVLRRHLGVASLGKPQAPPAPPTGPARIGGSAF